MTNRAPFTSEVYMPCAALQRYVAAFLTTSIDATGPSKTVDLFPMSHSVLAFALDDLPFFFDDARPVTSKLTFIGQFSRYHWMTVEGHYCYASVLFKPAGAYRLLGFAQNRLSDDFADLCQLLPGPETKALYGQLRALPQTDAPLAVKLLEDYLLRMLEKNAHLPDTTAVERACELIVDSGGNITVPDLGAAVGLSKSTLERHFLERIGLSPKKYCRVVRFNQVYQTLVQNGQQDWQQLVYQYAYYDQAHFIKDFKSFFGYTPSQIHQSLLNIADHVTSV